MKNTVRENKKFSSKKLNRIARIDAAAYEYFREHSSVNEIQAKQLMPLFISKGIFVHDINKGFPIRNLLREMKAGGQLRLFKQVKAVRNEKDNNWYFRPLE